MKILLLQTDLNPQQFQFVLHERQVVARVLTPPSHPGDLPLNGLKLILHNVGNVITVMDMVIFRTIFFELLVFFTFTLLTLHFAY